MNTVFEFHTNMFFFFTCIAQLTKVKYEQLGMSQKSKALSSRLKVT